MATEDELKLLNRYKLVVERLESLETQQNELVELKKDALKNRVFLEQKIAKREGRFGSCRVCGIVGYFNDVKRKLCVRHARVSATEKEIIGKTVKEVVLRGEILLIILEDDFEILVGIKDLTYLAYKYRQPSMQEDGALISSEWEEKL